MEDRHGHSLTCPPVSHESPAPAAVKGY